MELTLECKARPTGSKSNALRRAGLIPAVLYGHSGTDSVALTIDAKTSEILVRDAAVNNSLIQMNVPDLPWSGKALLREVHKHPWKGTVYHLSFFAIGTHASLEVDVPLHFVGTPTAIKQGGAVDTVMTSLHVKCAPTIIPETIEVDISGMEVGDALHVGQIVLPAGVTALVDGEQLVLSILPPQGGKTETTEG